MDDAELNRRELTGDDALSFAREAGMEEASRGGLFYAGVGDLIRFARLVRAGWTPPPACPECVGSGMRNLVHDCEACAGTGRAGVKASYSEVARTPDAPDSPDREKA